MRMKEGTRGKGEEGKREKGRIESDSVRAFVWNWDRIKRQKKAYMIREIRRATCPIWKASGLPRSPKDKRFGCQDERKTKEMT